MWSSTMVFLFACMCALSDDLLTKIRRVVIIPIGSTVPSIGNCLWSEHGANSSLLTQQSVGLILLPLYNKEMGTAGR